ncbi:MAG TPA: hypothetical protein PKY81_16110 [bacterium]|nr:hypothetical protein [bacterium]
MNNIKTIAWHTLICWIRNKVYIGFIAASFLLIAFAFICANITGLFQERVFVDSSIFFIELISIITAVFICSTTVIKDIQSKEIYYILSRPISKFQFLTGRFLGLTICVIALHLLITALFTLITSLYGFELTQKMKLYFFLVISLKIILVCSFSFVFSTYSTSFFPALILSFTLFFIFEFSESMNYWLTFYSQTAVFMKPVYNFLFLIMPNLVYYDIFYMFDINKFASLSSYTGFLALYTFIYSILFLIISLISFNKRSL